MKVSKLGFLVYVDKLGRIVLPYKIRNMFGITVNTSLEITTDGENIILHKYDDDKRIEQAAEEFIELCKGYDKDKKREVLQILNEKLK